MLDGLGSVEWHLEAQPSWNSPHEVAQAIRHLACATIESGGEAYSRMLYAVGNDQSGAYFPVVLATLPFLGGILRDAECDSVARARTLDVLIDLLGSFEPEPGYEFVATSAGSRPLKDLPKERALGLNADVDRLRTAPASPEETKLANELPTILREQVTEFLGGSRAGSSDGGHPARLVRGWLGKGRNCSNSDGERE